MADDLGINVVVWTVNDEPVMQRLLDAGVRGLITDRPDLLRATLEARGQWAKACELYEQILRQDRTLAEVKARYQDCLRRSHLTRRHRDPAYKRQVEQLTLARALDVYAEVLAKLQTYYVVRKKADLAPLFRQGLEELRLALADEGFVQEHLAGRRPAAAGATAAAPAVPGATVVASWLPPAQSPAASRPGGRRWPQWS